MRYNLLQASRDVAVCRIWGLGAWSTDRNEGPSMASIFLNHGAKWVTQEAAKRFQRRNLDCPRNFPSIAGWVRCILSRLKHEVAGVLVSKCPLFRGANLSLTKKGQPGLINATSPICVDICFWTFTSGIFQARPPQRKTGMLAVFQFTNQVCFFGWLFSG